MSDRNVIAKARRQRRVRYRLKQLNAGSSSLRLSVFRSSKHIYAQIIDDTAGKTVVAASSADKDFKGALKTGANTDAAKQVGILLGKRSVAAGINKVFFDRGFYMYHGRVKALADGAREGGLEF